MSFSSFNNWTVWGVGAAIGLFLLRRWIKGGQFTERVSAKGKIAVVTGGNAGIGKETVRGLNLAGAKVYMLCRNEQRANEAIVALVKMGCDPSRLIFVKCDLTSFASVRECAKKLETAEDHIDILANNAGMMFHPKHELTEDGHEITWQSNYLGPFLLTELLLPLVKKAEEGRIFNVSSMTHSSIGPLDLDKIDSAEMYTGYLPVYARTKLANVMHAVELTRRLQRDRQNTVTINSLHPGAVTTEIARNFWMFKYTRFLQPVMSFFFKTERDGAQTSLYLALSKKVKDVSGKYFSDCKVKEESAIARDQLGCTQLYEYSMKTVGLA